MAEVTKVSQYSTKPGIQRDGTDLDANLFNDGQWVRFVRATGRPKKMGGYRAISQYMTGPIRGLYVWSRQFLNAIYAFSSTTVEVLSADQNGVGSAISDRTPVTRSMVFSVTGGTFSQGESITGGTSLSTGVIAKLSGSVATLVYVSDAFTPTEVITGSGGATATVTSYTVTAYTGGVNYNWQIDTMYDAAADSQKSVIIAHAADNLSAIDDGTLTSIFIGDITDFTQPLEDTGQQVSGGIVVAAPYLISYGSDGKITWCNENEPLNIYTGSATTTRASASKIVKGLPLRSGSGTSVLLWALDSVIRLAWVGGTAIFRIDTLSAQSSILSSSSVIEYDGVFFWIGIDRFLTYNASVREVPNTVNLQWFFDNLNYEQRQKVTVTKIPRFGEIWWFFPSGDSVECDKAIIYNVRLDTWYDTDIHRSCGFYSQVFKYPIMANSTYPSDAVHLMLSSITGSFVIGDTVTATPSGATGRIVRTLGSTVCLKEVAGVFAVADTIAGSTAGSATVDSIDTDMDLYTVWAHEVGTDQVVGDVESAIQSYFETSDFGLPTGGIIEQQQGPNRWTRMVRLEPDFVQSGDMTVTVRGREFARAPERETTPLTFSPTTQKIDMRVQEREIRLRFESNVAGGDYEAGKNLMHLDPGDARS